MNIINLKIKKNKLKMLWNGPIKNFDGSNSHVRSTREWGAFNKSGSCAVVGPATFSFGRLRVDTWQPSCESPCPGKRKEREKKGKLGNSIASGGPGHFLIRPTDSQHVTTSMRKTQKPLPKKEKREKKWANLAIQN